MEIFMIKSCSFRNLNENFLMNLNNLLNKETHSKRFNRVSLMRSNKPEQKVFKAAYSL